MTRWASFRAMWECTIWSSAQKLLLCIQPAAEELSVRARRQEWEGTWPSVMSTQMVTMTLRNSRALLETRHLCQNVFFSERMIFVGFHDSIFSGAICFVSFGLSANCGLSVFILSVTDFPTLAKMQSSPFRKIPAAGRSFSDLLGNVPLGILLENYFSDPLGGVPW